MNPGEQDQNPFRRPSSASSMGTQNASRYFGTRSRYNANRTRNTQLTNAQPAQSYFPQAAQMQPVPAYAAPVAQQQRSGGKRKFLLIAAIIAVVGIITAIIVSIGINGGIHIKGMNHSLEDLQAVLGEYRDSIIDVLIDNEKALSGDQEFAISYSEEIGEKDQEQEEEKKRKQQEYKDNYTKKYEKIKAAREKLDDFGSITAYDPYENNVDINDLMKTLKESLDKYVAFYEKYYQLKILQLEIQQSYGEASSIEKLKNLDDGQNLEKLSKSITNLYSILKQVKNKCGEMPNSSTCIELSVKLSNAKKEIDQSAYNAYLKSIAVETTDENDPLIIINIILSMKAKQDE